MPEFYYGERGHMYDRKIFDNINGAIKHIISMLSSEKPLSNFFITEDDTDLKQ